MGKQELKLECSSNLCVFFKTRIKPPTLPVKDYSSYRPNALISQLMKTIGSNILGHLKPRWALLLPTVGHLCISTYVPHVESCRNTVRVVFFDFSELLTPSNLHCWEGKWRRLVWNNTWLRGPQSTSLTAHRLQGSEPYTDSSQQHGGFPRRWWFCIPFSPFHLRLHCLKTEDILRWHCNCGLWAGEE